MIEIGVIDDDQMLLQGMAAWIGSTGDIRLAATAASVEEYLATAHVPKIVILDLNLGNYTAERQSAPSPMNLTHVPRLAAWINQTRLTSIVQVS